MAFTALSPRARDITNTDKLGICIVHVFKCTNYEARIIVCAWLRTRMYGIIPSEARFLLGVPWKLSGFASIPKYLSY